MFTMLLQRHGASTLDSSDLSLKPYVWQDESLSMICSIEFKHRRGFFSYQVSPPPIVRGPSPEIWESSRGRQRTLWKKTCWQLPRPCAVCSSSLWHWCQFYRWSRTWWSRTGWSPERPPGSDLKKWASYWDDLLRWSLFSRGTFKTTSVGQMCFTRILHKKQEFSR